MIVRRYRWQAVTGCVIALAALAGCSTAPAAVSGPTATAAGATTGSGATTAPAATTAATVASPTAPTKALPTVDLVLSGPYAVTAKGTKGECRLGKDSSGNVRNFAFSAVEADYVGLGTGLFVDESSGTVTIKWLLNPNVGLLYVGDNKSISPDHRTFTIDADIKGGTVTEHIKGTITCP